MRVLHIITSLNDGGAEAVLYRLVTHDAVDEHHVVSLTEEGKYGPLLKEKGIDVTALGMLRGRFTVKGLASLWQVLRTHRPDVVQTWMYHADLVGGTLACMTGFPVVWGVRNTTLEPGQSRGSTIWTTRVCAVLSRRVPARIVVCAQAAREVHAALGYDVARMVVIPNGYDLGRLRHNAEGRKRLRNQWGVPDDVPLIGMVARHDPYKDHANLLAALERITQTIGHFQVVLVGTGMTEDNAALTSLIRRHGLERHVKLLGPRSDIPDLMSAIDLHVLSSSAEAFPNVLAEAMACGTPCVTTDVGDARLIVDDTGWVVPPRNFQALANALEQALAARHDAPSWKARQSRCRERVARRFGIEVMVQRYRAVWEEARQHSSQAKVA
jgi:glycosyltransferase involved in cell wall biosynthesis